MWNDPEPRPLGSPDGDAGQDRQPSPMEADTLVRTMEGRIIAWSAGMERRYGHNGRDARGQISHRLLRTAFPRALADIESELVSRNKWTGGVIHRHSGGGPVIAINHWSLCRNEANETWLVTEAHSNIVPTGAAMNECIADIIELAAHQLSEPLTAIANYVEGTRRVLRTGSPDLGLARVVMRQAFDQARRGGDGIRLLRTMAVALRDR
jgi:hypothetical protein